MREEEVQPFESVLDAVFYQEPVPIHLLYRLSDLTADQMTSFLAGWQVLPDERRRVVVQHMADISEENYVVDFGPLFAEFLQDGFTPVRVAALEGLWDSSSTRHIEPITRLLQDDESVDVKAAAAAALAHYVMMAEWGELPQRISPPIVAALLAVYEEPETAVSVKRAALEALAASAHPRVPDLIDEAYEHEDPEMQLSAVFAMGNTADPRWMSVILDEMQSHSDAMRAEAARAAGVIGKSDSVPELAELTMDEAIEVRMAAVYALGQIGGERPQEILAAILADPDQEELHEMAEEAMEEMMWMGGELDLLDFAGDDDESEFYEN
ncbi:MAG: HEAT repeat domain-containing protein [Anaerolineales bacterium]|nr:HEAT repeat domain-containing protein [Anaerolineales bacterium]